MKEINRLYFFSEELPVKRGRIIQLFHGKCTGKKMRKNLGFHEL